MVPATVAEEGVVAGGPSENPPKSPIEAIPGTTVSVPQCVDTDGVLATVAEEGVVAGGPVSPPEVESRSVDGDVAQALEALEARTEPKKSKKRRRRKKNHNSPWSLRVSMWFRRLLQKKGWWPVDLQKTHRNPPLKPFLVRL